MGINFCSHCGIKLEGELKCREHFEPRWLYELRERGIDYTRNYKEKTRGWVIEERDTWVRNGKPDPDAKWEIKFQESDHDHVELKDVVYHLQWEREHQREQNEDREPLFPDYYLVTEFRARIIEYPKRPAYSHTRGIYGGRGQHPERSLLQAWKREDTPNSALATS